MKRKLRRLLCRIFDHQWRWEWRYGKYEYNYCARCGKCWDERGG